MHRLYLAHGAAAFDHIAHLEGTEYNHQEACREVSQRTLQCQANGQAGCTKNGNKGCGLNPQLRQCRNNHEGQQRKIDDIAHETDNDLVDLCLSHHPLDDAPNCLGNPFTNYEYNQGKDQLQTILRAQLHCHLRPFTRGLGVHHLRDFIHCVCCITHFFLLESLVFTD